MNSFFGSPPTYGSSPPLPLPVGPLSPSSKPPPSPPRASSWEFLNPFESFDKYYPSYTPSRNYKEMREEEGIPELEDDEYHQEIVKKEVYEDGGGGINYAKSVAVDEEGGKPNFAQGLSQKRPSVSMANNDGVVYEVHVEDNKVGIDNVDKSGDRENVAARVGLQGDSEVVREIQVQFQRASDFGSEFANMLEVGKLPYHRKNAIYQGIRICISLCKNCSFEVCFLEWSG